MRSAPDVIANVGVKPVELFSSGMEGRHPEIAQMYFAAQLLVYRAERATPPVTTNQPYGGVLAHFSVDSLIISTNGLFDVSNKECMCFFFYHFITGCGHLGAVDLAFNRNKALERAARACTGVDAVVPEGGVDSSASFA